MADGPLSLQEGGLSLGLQLLLGEILGVLLGEDGGLGGTEDEGGRRRLPLL